MFLNYHFQNRHRIILKIIASQALALPVDEINSIPNNIKDKRAAAVILSNYVSIKDSLYSLDISKEEAQKIGIDADFSLSPTSTYAFRK